MTGPEDIIAVGRLLDGSRSDCAELATQIHEQCGLQSCAFLKQWRSEQNREWSLLYLHSNCIPGKFRVFSNHTKIPWSLCEMKLGSRLRSWEQAFFHLWQVGLSKIKSGVVQFFTRPCLPCSAGYPHLNAKGAPSICYDYQNAPGNAQPIEVELPIWRSKVLI